MNIFNHICISLLSAAMMLMTSAPASADDIMLDEGRQIEGLWVFPSLSEPTRWRYIPQNAQLVTNEDGAPMFGLTFFVSNDAADTDDPLDPSTISDAEGGALLHLLVEYKTDPELLEMVQATLRTLLDDETAELVGPVIFDDGHYSVVTSIAGEGAQSSPTLLAHRPAPLTEGNRVAISARLSAEEATLLLGTLRTDTPDFSVLFQMTFEGLSQAFAATMVIDWEKTKHSINAGAGGSVYYISADVEATMEKLMQDGAITLEINGDDQDMEALIDRTHARATEMMFSPIEPAEAAADTPTDLVGALGALIAPDGLLGSRNTTGFGLGVSFKLKDLRAEGETRLSFNKRAPVPRRTVLLVNLGEVADLSGDAVKYISTVDPATQLRKVFVGVDGTLQHELGGFINSVTVSLRKEHPEGRETLQQIVVRPESEGVTDIHGPMTYSNLEREPTESWLQYEVDTEWNFQGGGTYHSGWADMQAPVVNLMAPFHRQQIIIEGDTTPLLDAGTRAVVIEVSAPLFGDMQTQRRIFRPSEDIPFVDIDPIQLILPRDEWHFDWTVTWLMNDRTRRVASGHDDLGFLFIDEIPPAEITILNEPSEQEN